jgi:hypothetical protein
MEVGQIEENIRSTSIEQETSDLTEMCKSVGRSPSFVIQLRRKDGGELQLSDVKNIVRIRNLLIGENENAIDLIHKEGQAAHVSGLFLKREGLTTFDNILKSFSGEEVDGFDEIRNSRLEASVAMAVPEEGDEQWVTISDGNFTIYGSSVVALSRGHKVVTGDLASVPVFELAGGDVNAMTTRKGEKFVQKDSNIFDDPNFVWATEKQIRDLPGMVFEKMDPDAINKVTIDSSEILAIKPDESNSGQKIKSVEIPDSEDEREQAVAARKMIVAANYRMISEIARELEDYSKEIGEKYFVANMLGDSVVLFMEKDGMLIKKYQELIKKKTEEELSDATKDNLLGSREEMLGHFSSIVLPVEGEITLFRVGDRVICFDANWNPMIERHLETLHKKTNRPSSEIVSKDGYEDFKVRYY